MKRIFFTIALACLCIGAHNTVAQDSRPLDILQSNPDVRSVAMGNTHVGETDRMHLYTNPSALLFGSRFLSVDVSGEMYRMDKLDGVEGTLMQYNATAGFRFFDRHAVFAGFRYLGGLSMANVGDDLEAKKRKTSPYDYTMDLGYAFRLFDGVSLFASGSYIASYTGRSGVAYAFTVGASYRTDLQLGTMPAFLNVVVKGSDWGTVLQYSGGGRSVALPSSLSGNVTFGLTPARDHDIVLTLGDRFYVMPAKARANVFGVGAEYGFRKMVYVRGGYEQELDNIGHLSMGLGVNIKGVRLDAAYRMESGNKTGVNTLLVGLGFTM